MTLKDLLKVCLLTVFCSFVLSCSQKDEVTKRMEKDSEALALKERKAQYKRDLLETKAKELELAKLKAAEQEAKIKLLNEKLLKEKEEAKQKIADEKEAKRLEEIERRQKIQQVVLKAFIKTEFEELELLDGKVLKSAKVTDANPVKVSFIHRNGVARVKYSNLPEEIREACKYDEELEIVELDERKAAKLEKLAQASNTSNETGDYQSAKTGTAGKVNNSNNRITKSDPPEVPFKAKPKGNLSVRVVATNRGNKTINVIAKSNVDAVLYLNDYWRPYRRHSVKANEVYTYVWRGVGTKYEVKLTAKGKVLDKESSGRKSGLGTNGGL